MEARYDAAGLFSQCFRKSMPGTGLSKRTVRTPAGTFEKQVVLACSNMSYYVYIYISIYLNMSYPVLILFPSPGGRNFLLFFFNVKVTILQSVHKIQRSLLRTHCCSLSLSLSLSSIALSSCFFGHHYCFACLLDFENQEHKRAMYFFMAGSCMRTTRSKGW